MITLTMNDEKRLEIIQRVFRAELTVIEAALILGVSERQCCRNEMSPFLSFLFAPLLFLWS